MAAPRTPLPPEFLTRPIAHRALHDVSDGRPENSRAAIMAAIKAGYGIEIDLQISSDGCAMVFHDYDLARLTGQSGPIQRRSAAELADIGLLGGNETIPTFSEVLKMVAGRVPLLVEIKDQDGMLGGSVGALETAAAKDAAGYKGPLAFMSFNPHSVRVIGGHAPDVARGIVTSAYAPDDWQLIPVGTRDRLRRIPDFDSARASFISHEAADLSRSRVAEIRKKGWPVLCWTIRSPEQEAAARAFADNVTFEGYLPPVSA